MHDLAARMPLERPLGQQPDEVVALDERPALVKEEASVEIAVPGDAKVGLLGHDGGGGHRPVLEQHGIRHPIREVAVRRVVELDELKRQCCSSRSITGPAPPLPALTTILSGRSLPRSM